MPPNVRSKTILESQDSVSDIIEATHERFVPAMVEEFEKNTVDFLQEAFASNRPFGIEAGIGNINDDDTHIPNVVEFQAMIKNLQRLNVLVGQRFDERMAAQAKANSKQLKVL